MNTNFQQVSYSINCVEANIQICWKYKVRVGSLSEFQNTIGHFDKITRDEKWD